MENIIMKNISNVINKLRTELERYILENNLKTLVIGVSGGIDSALCVALAEPVCQKLNIALIGRSLPIESNKPEEIDRADAIGSAFAIDFTKIDLTDEYNLEKQSVRELEATVKINGRMDDKAIKIRNGNIKARMRMTRLYNLASYTGGMVLSTDNFTEYMEGFFTKHGDVGDFGMIQNLWKTEVYELASYLVNEYQLNEELAKANALENCIKARVTDGLGVTNSTLEQLQATSFDEVDGILQAYLAGDRSNLESPIIKRHRESVHKREYATIARDTIFL